MHEPERLLIPLHPDNTVPQQYPVTLYFEAHYDENKIWSYIQDVRARAIMQRRTKHGRETADKATQSEEAYWQRLNELRRSSAAFFLDQGIVPDLIVDPPSNTGYHRPYLSAFLTAYPHADYCYLFKKDITLESGTGKTSFMQMHEGTELRHRDDVDLAAKKTVLIVDDIFSKGLVAAVTIHKVKPLVNPDAAFLLFCPLRLPSRNPADELEEMMARMSAVAGF